MTDPMKPSEVRERVRADHARLREMLDRIDALAARFEDGAPGVGSELRARGRELFEFFSEHLQLENSELVPALRLRGKDGETRAERLEHEHREQRELIQFLIGRLGESDRPTRLIATELKNFGEYLRLDMDHEENDLLRDALFDD